MLILIEGPDGAGKTTFAHKLKKQIGHNALVVHKGPPQQDPITEYTVDVQWYRPGRGLHVICDRWHWGEEVYGPLFRGGSSFEDATFSHVEKALEVRGAFVVLLRHDPDVLAKRLRDRGDDMVSPDHVQLLLDAYFDVSVKSELPWYSFRGDTEHAIDQVIRFASIRDEAYQPLNVFETYVGPRYPKYLLLGERRNSQPPHPHEAAFTPGNATSGLFLLRALPPEIRADCGLANACEENVHELWETLGRPPTVALGVASATACREAKVPCGVVPHPQYIRRFFHGQGELYGKRIARALESKEDLRTWKRRLD